MFLRELRLQDYLILYSKANIDDDEVDEQRKIKLEDKRKDAKEAALLLAQTSNSVDSLIRARLPEHLRRPNQAFYASSRPSPFVDFESASSRPIAPRSAGTLSSTKKKKLKTSSAIKSASVHTSSAKRGRPKKNIIESPILSSSKKKQRDTADLFVKKKKRNMSSPSSDSDRVERLTKKQKTKKSAETKPVSLKNQSSSSVADDIPYLKRRIAKDFDGEIYFGYIKGFVPSSNNRDGVDLWSVEYDDGDAEDMEEDELMHGFLLYRKNAANDRVGNAVKRKEKKMKYRDEKYVDKKRKVK
jgi:hypothetical protein